MFVCPTHHLRHQDLSYIRLRVKPAIQLLRSNANIVGKASKILAHSSMSYDPFDFFVIYDFDNLKASI